MVCPQLQTVSLYSVLLYLLHASVSHGQSFTCRNLISERSCTRKITNFGLAVCKADPSFRKRCCLACYDAQPETGFYSADPTCADVWPASLCAQLKQGFGNPVQNCANDARGYYYCRATCGICALNGRDAQVSKENQVKKSVQDKHEADTNFTDATAADDAATTNKETATTDEAASKKKLEDATTALTTAEGDVTSKKEAMDTANADVVKKEEEAKAAPDDTDKQKALADAVKAAEDAKTAYDAAVAAVPPAQTAKNAAQAQHDLDAATLAQATTTKTATVAALTAATAKQTQVKDEIIAKCALASPDATGATYTCATDEGAGCIPPTDNAPYCPSN